MSRSFICQKGYTLCYAWHIYSHLIVIVWPPQPYCRLQMTAAWQGFHWPFHWSRVCLSQTRIHKQYTQASAAHTLTLTTLRQGSKQANMQLPPLLSSLSHSPHLNTELAGWEKTLYMRPHRRHHNELPCRKENLSESKATLQDSQPACLSACMRFASTRRTQSKRNGRLLRPCSFYHIFASHLRASDFHSNLPISISSRIPRDTGKTLRLRTTRVTRHPFPY